jgi:NADH:ubiquinone oxidoreductase subunit B-like Fe-S oxidoreductase
MGLVDRGRLPKPLNSLFNMGRSYSLWVYQWGLACCAIEMGAAFGSPRYDVMRLGVIPLPASPRQADLVVISGTVTDKMAPAIKRLYEQMPEPKLRHFHGKLRKLRRSILGQLLSDKGRRSNHSS